MVPCVRVYCYEGWGGGGVKAVVVGFPADWPDGKPEWLAIIGHTQQVVPVAVKLKLSPTYGL